MTATNGFERLAAAIDTAGRVTWVGSNTWAEHDSEETVTGLVAGTFQIGGRLYLTEPVDTRGELAAANRLARRLGIRLALFSAAKGELLAWLVARAECRCRCR